MSTTMATRPKTAAPGAFQTLPIDQVDESALNTRRRFDPKSIDELAASIRAHGVLTPILVRPKGKRFEIAAGARRLRAARKAQLTEIPAVVREMDDVQFLEVITIENLQREDVHPLDEALGYKALIEKAGYDAQQIADRIGKSLGYVYARMKLAELIPPLQKQFLDGSITASHAVLVARLQPKDQARVLADGLFDEEYVGGGAAKRNGAAVSVRALNDWIHEYILLDLARAPWDKADATLYAKAGPCTTCPKRAGNQPQLFPDVAKGDVCTDPTCFAVKMANWLSRKVEEAKEEHGDIVRLTTDWNGERWDGGKTRKIDAVPRGQWKQVRAGSCLSTKAGIIVDGEHKGLKAGDVLTVCTDPKCKTHGAGASYREVPTARQRAASKAGALNARIKSRTRNRILDEILARITHPMNRRDLELVARQWWCRLWHDAKKLILSRRKLEPVKRKSSYGGTETDAEAPMRQVIPKLTDAELYQLLMEMALAQDVDRSTWYSGPDRLLAAAKERKIDVARLEREVRKELTPAPVQKHSPGSKRRVHTSTRRKAKAT